MDVWLRDGLGNVARTVGKALSNVPILRDGSVDEALTQAGDQLKQLNKNDLSACLQALEPLHDHRMATFAENTPRLSISATTKMLSSPTAHSSTSTPPDKTHGAPTRTRRQSADKAHDRKNRSDIKNQRRFLLPWLAGFLNALFP